VPAPAVVEPARCISIDVMMVMAAPTLCKAIVPALA
jgi:hypothetical protein